MTHDNTTKIGIMILETRSIPFLTPANTIISVKSEKAIKHNSVETPLEINVEK